jgi:hypothetical protein
MASARYSHIPTTALLGLVACGSAESCSQETPSPATATSAAAVRPPSEGDAAAGRSDAGASSLMRPAVKDAGGTSPKLAGFDWRIPAAAQVREQRYLGDLEAELSYRISLCADARNGSTLRLTGLEFRTVDGKPATDPETSKALDEIRPLMAAVPQLQINAEGRCVGISGVEAMLKGIEHFDPAIANKVRAAFATEKGRRAMELAAKEIWRSWVETWLYYDPARGKHYRLQTTGTDLIPASSFDFAYLGTTADGLVMLRVDVATLDAEQAGRAAQAVVEAVRPGTEHGRVTATARFEVALDPVTRRPHWVRYEKQAALADASSGSADRREFSFTWLAATEAQKMCAR